MIHISAEVYAACPKAFNRVREKLGLISPTTVRRRMKENDFGDGGGPELQDYVVKIIQQKKDKAEFLGQYSPTEEGKVHPQFF
jgi:hypothetical protein